MPALRRLHGLYGKAFACANNSLSENGHDDRFLVKALQQRSTYILAPRSTVEVYSLGSNRACRNVLRTTNSISCKTAALVYNPGSSLAAHSRRASFVAFPRRLRIQQLTNPITGRVPANASSYFKRPYRKCLNSTSACNFVRLALPIGSYRFSFVIRLAAWATALTCLLVHPLLVMCLIIVDFGRILGENLPVLGP